MEDYIKGHNLIEGDDLLHNDIVDALITFFNYQAQTDKHGITREDAYIVMDMETLEDIYGNSVPYRITTIRVEVKNGKTKIHPYTAYFNNSAFFDVEKVTFKEPGKKAVKKEVRGRQLEKFYQQQRDMYKDIIPDVNVIDARTDLIVKKMREHTTSPDDIMNLLTILKDPFVKIVAHGGYNFDFPNFHKYMKNYAEHLIPNFYYRLVKDKTFKDFKSDILEANPDYSENEYQSAVINTYKQELKNILDGIKKSGRDLTKNDINLINKFYDAITVTIYLKNYNDALEARGALKDRKMMNDLLTGKESLVSKIAEQIVDIVIYTKR